MTGLNRAGYYRWRGPRQGIPVEMELRDQVQKIALEWPAYGYRRITAELRRNGFEINHKRVLRLMRADNLLCVRRRAFVLTTDSRHGLPVYPNLARELAPAAVNQLWVADITYIRLRDEFVYLAVTLDAFSRKVVGGRWGGRSRRNCPWPRCAWHWRRGNPRPAWCIIPTGAFSTRRTPTPIC